MLLLKKLINFFYKSLIILIITFFVSLIIDYLMGKGLLSEVTSITLFGDILAAIKHMIDTPEGPLTVVSRDLTEAIGGGGGRIAKSWIKVARSYKDTLVTNTLNILDKVIDDGKEESLCLFTQDGPGQEWAVCIINHYIRKQFVEKMSTFVDRLIS